MKDGFVSVAAVSPEVRVADVDANIAAIIDAATHAAEAGAKLVVMPELAISGATCGDLFYQEELLDACESGLARIAVETGELDAVLVLGTPARVNGKLYDCAAVVSSGRILGLVPRRVLSSELARQFSAAGSEAVLVDFAGSHDIPFGSNQLFACDTMPGLVLAAELGDDLVAPRQPSTHHALAGATVICHLAATPELVGSPELRRSLATFQSRRLVCAYVMANAGAGESTTDAAYGAHNIVAECGRILAESAPFGDGVAQSEADVQLIANERRRSQDFRGAPSPDAAGYPVSYFALEQGVTRLTRRIEPNPFVPADDEERESRCEHILSIQATGLAKRLSHVGSQRAVLGISGGLDSTLALLVTCRAFDALGLSRDGILAITMPGFGTTGRTYDNACRLTEALGATLLEIDIQASVRQHFADIGHDEAEHDATYENSQARERTQILMDVANAEGGLVVGTGDLSELVLGWATYNGDHMSMYGVNGAIPKTLVRHLVRHVANTCGDVVVERTLLDVLDTPVSPELLPASADGTISQRTEDLVGPYELHDFFIYQVLRHGFGPAKVLRLAREAWGATYDDDTIEKWLRVFLRRLFSQQFKRSCLPDGPAVGSVGISPRGGLAMPSDALAATWLASLD